MFAEFLLEAVWFYSCLLALAFWQAPQNSFPHCIVIYRDLYWLVNLSGAQSGVA